MKKFKVFAGVICTFALLGIVPDSVYAEENETPAGYVVMSAEKFVLGEGFLKEPEKVPFYDGETGTDIAERFFGKENLNGSSGAGTYIGSVRDAVKSDKPDIPEYILKAIEKTAENSISERNDSEWLSGSDYYSSSGWLYKINNEMAVTGLNDYTPKDGDVIRYEFSLYEYGADIGADNSSWGGSPAIVIEADRDKLYTLLAETKGNTSVSDVYKKALDACMKLTAGEDEIEKAETELENALKVSEKVSAEETTASAKQENVTSSDKAGQSSSSPKTGEKGMTGAVTALFAGAAVLAVSMSWKKNRQ